MITAARGLSFFDIFVRGAVKIIRQILDIQLLVIVCTLQKNQARNWGRYCLLVRKSVTSQVTRLVDLCNEDLITGGA